MDSTQIAGVIRHPTLRMQHVKIVVARVFHMYDEQDERYVALDYEPCLILTSALMNNRAMSHISYLPIHTLHERIGAEIKNMALEDAKAQLNALKVENETSVIKIENEK